MMGKWECVVDCHSQGQGILIGSHWNIWGYLSINIIIYIVGDIAHEVNPIQ